MFDEFDLKIRHAEAVDEDNIYDDTEDQFQIDVYDEEGDWYAQCVSKNFIDCLRHALYLANPTLAASSFTDYFEWIEQHNTKLG